MSFTRPVDEWFISAILPHEPTYMAAAIRLCGSREEACDLVHDVYAKLIMLGDWEDILVPRAYVLRMIRHRAISRMRRQKIVEFQHLAEACSADLMDDTPDAQRIVEGREQVAFLNEAMSALPAACRQAVVMRRIEERTPTEISRMLGVSISTIEKRIARGMLLLVRAFDRRNADVRPASDTQSEMSEARSTLASSTVA